MHRNVKIVLIVAVGACLLTLAGCAADGGLLPPGQWFSAGPDGVTPYEQATDPVRDAAGVFGPVGDLVALGILGVGAVGTAVTGIAAKRRGVQVKQIGPAFQRVVKAIGRIHRDRPELWAEVKAELKKDLEPEDELVIAHFRDDKPKTELKSLRGVGS